MVSSMSPIIWVTAIMGTLLVEGTMFMISQVGVVIKAAYFNRICGEAPKHPYRVPSAADQWQRRKGCDLSLSLVQVDR